jgi:hypothetical protein
VDSMSHFLLPKAAVNLSPVNIAPLHCLQRCLQPAETSRRTKFGTAEDAYTRVYA